MQTKEGRTKQETDIFKRISFSPIDFLKSPFLFPGEENGIKFLPLLKRSRSNYTSIVCEPIPAMFLTS